MKTLTLLGGLSASLLLTGALSAQAPFNATPRSGPGAYTPTTAAGGGVINSTTTETFETYVLSPGGAENLNITYLDENAIANGQGPGLVLDGCIYACNAGSLQWNDAGYYGQPSRDILANSGDGLLIMKYDVAVQGMALTLHAFDGYPDNTTINVYDSNGTLIHTSAGIAVPNSAPVAFSFSAPDIRSITIQSNAWPWGTIIDDHVFGGSGPTLAKQGTCPGPMTLRVDGATPGGPVAIVHGPAGSYTRSGNPCNGIVLGISNPTLGAIVGANGSGVATLSFNAPAGACGRTVQAVDVNTCATTNTIIL